MNKSELISVIAEKSGLTKADSKKSLDATIAAITEALQNGDKIALVGFGSFAISERAARVGVNLQTKQPMTIEAKKVVKFKAGAELAEAVK